MAGLAPLIGEMLGVERAAIVIEEEGLRHSVRVDVRSTSSRGRCAVRGRDR